MPLYEYECETCGHRFEVIQKFSDAPVERCPKCGGPVHKLMSSPAIQFKGSGWYITDYARKDSGGGKEKSAAGETKSETKSDASAESKGETKTETKSETKADSKPAAKADAKPAG
jgi:putative FmdB family regulatory protein